MLALVEKFLDRIRKASTDADVIEILSEVSATLGFRSGFLIEYETDLKSSVHILDSNPARQGWWQEFTANGFRTNTPEVAALLERGGVQVFDGERFSSPNDPLLAFARRVDIIDLVLVPISFNGVVVGVGGFSGLP
ncbi:MAG: hypothetical protein ABI414_01620, partial [Devosia sp.]